MRQLLTALRAGLSNGSVDPRGLTLPSPLGTDPFDIFASFESAQPADASAQHTEDLPREALPANALAALTDRRLSLMTQDLAAFGGVGRETVRIAPTPEGHRLDYFA
jgi:hypothetical protein